jgi:hypothetical protein
MIQGYDALDLATRIHEATQEHQHERKTYEVHPSQMWAAERHRARALVPMLTSHGDSTQLAQLIQTFHQWGQTIHIGVHCSDGLFQFWVEQDAR